MSTQSWKRGGAAAGQLRQGRASAAELMRHGADILDGGRDAGDVLPPAAEAADLVRERREAGGVARAVAGGGAAPGVLPAVEGARVDAVRTAGIAETPSPGAPDGAWRAITIGASLAGRLSSAHRGFRGRPATPRRGPGRSCPGPRSSCPHLSTQLSSSDRPRLRYGISISIHGNPTLWGRTEWTRP